jgi:abortive infection bacteriophage resistance protein
MRNIINFRDIIKDLSQRGLNIVDKSVLAYYIRNFNHNTFIEGYSVPFYDVDNKYDKSASSDQLISLFKFDSDMANHILRFILVVEKIMNTNITYGIINEYGIQDKCLFKLDRRFIEHNIMPNINDILPRTNYDHLSLKLIKYLSTNTMTKKYSDRNSKDEVHRWRTCPLDLMCLT